jgi:wyosine [tRNA(Phe)-imidazoG37] synthetase (radical SAM superfamily)
MSESPPNPQSELFRTHSRQWRDNRYVYPVCSRRSGGISIGINLNLDLRCTFNCVYCQVDRTGQVWRNAARPVDLDVVRAELTAMLSAAASGELLASPEFAGLSDPLRRINDVAFSGDGEPTGCPQFAEAADLVEQVVAASGLDVVRVLITNGSLLHLESVCRGLEALHRRHGEVWAKLDAGTEGHFQRIARTAVPLSRIVENLTWSAQHWPIVVQSCFMHLAGGSTELAEAQGPSVAEIDAYCDRLADILQAGGKISRVQIYTVARPPTENFVTPLPPAQVDAIVSAVSKRFAGMVVQPFYGPG